MRWLWILFLMVLIASFAKPYIQDTLFMIQLLREPPYEALQIPVEGVNQTQIANTWEAPRSDGRKHQGIDIFAPKGTPVESTTPGVVWRVGENGLGGNAIWILGPGGQIHYYAHLDHFAGIKARDRITQGEIVGYVGNTGNARGTHPHLHYGIYSPAGKAINPFPLLKGIS